MSNLHLNLPEEVHKPLKVQAAVKGVSLKSLVIDILESRYKNDRN